MKSYENKKVDGSKSTASTKLKGIKVRFLRSPLSRFKLSYIAEDVAVVFDERLAKILIKEGYAEECK